MKILQRNLNRSTFVVWEMKRNVSVVCVCSAPNCCNILISGKIIKEMPGSVASGTHCIMGPPLYMRSVADRNVAMRRIPVYLYLYRVPTLNIGWQQLCNRSNSSAAGHDGVTGRVIPDVPNISVFIFHFHRLDYCLKFNPDGLASCLRIHHD